MIVPKLSKSSVKKQDGLILRIPAYMLNPHCAGDKCVFFDG